MLEYYLEPNALTGNPDDLKAQVVNVQSHSQSDIVDRLMKIGAGLTRSDVVSVLEAEKQVICDIIAEGEAVYTDLFSAYPSIQGVFTPGASGAAVTVDAEPASHAVHINLNAGAALRKVCEAVKTKRVAAAPAGPRITMVYDLTSGAMNSTITSDRVITIQGSKIKIVGANPSCGLYFKNLSTGAEDKFGGLFVENMPTRLTLQLPDYAAGTYRIYLVTQYSSGSDVKEPRRYDFPMDLTVVEA
jgi:hypothetical protein